MPSSEEPHAPHVQPVVLAGGRGTRLAPLTRVIPKPLMPVGDEPIVDILLAQLARQGWGSVTLAVGHMAHLVRAYCGAGERYGLEVEYIEEEYPLGTVGPLALLPAEHRLGDLLVMNGDLLTDLRFNDLVAAHVKSHAIATLAVQSRHVQIDFGVVEIDKTAAVDMRVSRYLEKPPLSATVSIGAYAFRPEVLQYIEPGERLDLPDLVNRLLDNGEVVSAYPHEGYWLDIGQHADYEKAVSDFALQRDQILGPEVRPSRKLAV